MDGISAMPLEARYQNCGLHCTRASHSSRVRPVIPNMPRFDTVNVPPLNCEGNTVPARTYFLTWCDDPRPDALRILRWENGASSTTTAAK